MGPQRGIVTERSLRRTRAGAGLLASIRRIELFGAEIGDLRRRHVGAREQLAAREPVLLRKVPERAERHAEDLGGAGLDSMGALHRFRHVATAKVLEVTLEVEAGVPQDDARLAGAVVATAKLAG